MCKLLEDYGEERKEEGRVEGREEGIQIGHTEGRTEEKVSVITRLLKLGYTDWNMIAQIADCCLDLIKETAGEMN